MLVAKISAVAIVIMAGLMLLANHLIGEERPSSIIEPWTPGQVTQVVSVGEKGNYFPNLPNILSLPSGELHLPHQFPDVDGLYNWLSATFEWPDRDLTTYRGRTWWFVGTCPFTNRRAVLLFVFVSAGGPFHLVYAHTTGLDVPVLPDGRLERLSAQIEPDVTRLYGAVEIELPTYRLMRAGDEVLLKTEGVPPNSGPDAMNPEQRRHALDAYTAVGSVGSGGEDEVIVYLQRHGIIAISTNGLDGAYIHVKRDRVRDAATLLNLYAKKWKFVPLSGNIPPFPRATIN